MRNTLPSLTILPPQSSSHIYSQQPKSAAADSPPQHIPTIRLVNATAYATGSVSEANTSLNNSFETSQGPSPLAPRTNTGISTAPRKRLVPKKSKLGLLGHTAKSKSQGDFSDVLRRVGGTTSAGRGAYDVYVDRPEDTGAEEVVLVKKKKSRLGLDGVFGNENAPQPKTSANLLKPKGSVNLLKPKTKGSENSMKAKAVENLVKPKAEEKDKWWSISRGRKDSSKDSKRSKSPEASSRARFNSLDSGVLLTNPPNASHPHPPYGFGTNQSQTRLVQPIHNEDYFGSTDGRISPVIQPMPVETQASGSIAVRAMRSMRSMASIGGWVKSKNEETDIDATPKPQKTEIKKKSSKEKKTKEKILRMSISGLEMGTAKEAAPPTVPDEEIPRSLGKKKHSVLGFGIPSSMRFGSVRALSTASTTSSIAGSQPPHVLKRSSLTIVTAQRPSSTTSESSSLRPPSTISATSMKSPNSGTSVKWDEARLQTVRKMRTRDREERRKSTDSAATLGGKKRDTRKSSEGTRRPLVTDIFLKTADDPQVASPQSSSLSQPTISPKNTEANVEEAASPPIDTPVQRVKVKPRPVSEQMVGKPSRPPAFYDIINPSGAISVLDAATNDLASLINRLDLEATPCTPDGTPFRRATLASLQRSASSFASCESPTALAKNRKQQVDSPLRRAVTMRASEAALSSMRPYSCVSRSSTPPVGGDTLVGKRILPWNELTGPISPVTQVKAAPANTRPTHRRTMSPPLPEFDPPPVFQPLRPPKVRQISTRSSKGLIAATSSADLTELDTPVIQPLMPVFSTFGERPSKISTKKRSDSVDTISIQTSTPPPVFKLRHSKTKSSSLIPLETHKRLGTTSTLGSNKPDVDAQGPNFDIPDELQFLLSAASDNREMPIHDSTSTKQSAPPVSFKAPRVELKSEAQNPVFHAPRPNETLTNINVENSMSDDTNKSFDFTVELKRLTESSDTSDRRSFMEQLETAFRTPARAASYHDILVPPVPQLPVAEPHSPIISSDEEDSGSFAASKDPERNRRSDNEDYCSRLDITMEDAPAPPSEDKSMSSENSLSLAGQLNTSFKFGGGTPSSFEPKYLDIPASCRAIRTLSEIIPPTSQHSRNNSVDSHTTNKDSHTSSGSSYVEEDSAVLKSIFAHVTNVLPRASEVAVPRPRRRVPSNASSQRYSREMSAMMKKLSCYGPDGEDSRVSFLGFDSFDEVRRGFEFGADRPAFYPPPDMSSGQYNKHDSMFSIASISSYGSVIDSGDVDPFGYARNQSRPPSEDLSMSMTVDDTFDFMHKGRRARVNSNASSIYVKPAASMMGPIRRGYRARDSVISVTSGAPPVSMYNRRSHVYGARRPDSTGSISSMTYSYAMHGGTGGKANTSRCSRYDYSRDSIMSDYSPAPVARPGLGDKMLESAFDHGMPLSSISASPSQSTDGRFDFARYDSLVNSRRSGSQEDSLFDNTGSSGTSDSAFFNDSKHSNISRGAEGFRPVSVISLNSVHNPRRDDDTMISMLGGGRVRKVSVESAVAQSPCAKKRKHGTFREASMPIEEEFSPNKNHGVEKPSIASVAPTKSYNEYMPSEGRTEESSPKKVRLSEKASIASIASTKFGDERMTSARRGILDRQSLEESCLVAEGEDLASFVHDLSFIRPGEPLDSCSNTLTSIDSGSETPPLSSDASSMSGSSSQSSIDMGNLNVVLSNVTHPFTRPTRRVKDKGHSHLARHRVSEVPVSRSSVYETIQEESPIAPRSVAVPDNCDQIKLPDYSAVYVVEDNEEVNMEWDDDRGIIAMRRYCALKDEAQDTVEESRRVWMDTPLSLFALQTFKIPNHPSGMRELLEHSRSNYRPLPHRRSRTYSRPSPYPVRAIRRSLTSENPRPDFGDVYQAADSIQPLQSKPTNVLSPSIISTFGGDFHKSKAEKDTDGCSRPCVTSNPRKSALGSAKRSGGKSSDLKENAGVGTLTNPSDSLRINRPRPRGRPNAGTARAAAPSIALMPRI